MNGLLKEKTLTTIGVHVLFNNGNRKHSYYHDLSRNYDISKNYEIAKS